MIPCLLFPMQGRPIERATLPKKGKKGRDPPLKAIAP